MVVTTQVSPLGEQGVYYLNAFKPVTSIPVINK